MILYDLEMFSWIHQLPNYAGVTESGKGCTLVLALLKYKNLDYLSVGSVSSTYCLYRSVHVLFAL